MTQRSFTVRQALEFLDIDLPKIKQEMTQRDVNKLVADWKDNELKSRYRERVREEHPDKHGNSEESNRMAMDLRIAYDKVRHHLKMRRPPPKPSEVGRCPRCRTIRIPKNAIHCHDCGTRYRLEKPRTECPCCGTKREPSRAKFCHLCGYNYKVPDPIHEILRSKGVRESVIQRMDRDGTLDGLRGMNPLSPQFQRMVDLFGSTGGRF